MIGRRVLLALGAGVCLACTASEDRPMEIRQWTDDLVFRITVAPSPPAAEEDAVYKVVVQDKNTGQPIETGHGRVFASNKEQAQTDDGLERGKEIGTYYARLRFPVSGEWAVGLQFQRDSTRPLERTQDWTQSVSYPSPPVADTSKSHSH